MSRKTKIFTMLGFIKKPSDEPKVKFVKTGYTKPKAKQKRKAVKDDE